jgi:hypothetical protein
MLPAFSFRSTPFLLEEVGGVVDLLRVDGGNRIAGTG